MKLEQIFILLLVIIFSFDSCVKDEVDPNQNEVVGSIRDVSSYPYPNTLVKISNAFDEFETKTNSEGFYGFNINNSGTYELEIIPPLGSSGINGNTIDVSVQTNVEKTVNFEIVPQAIETWVVIDSIDIFGEIRNEAGIIPIEPEELIYARNVFDPPLGLLTPIKTPTGHHVTFSEWKNAQGVVRIKCNGHSSEVGIAMANLIPNGTYSFWLNYLNKKKMPGEILDLVNDVVKIEPVGSGSLNVAQADDNGMITVFIDHPSCIVTEEIALIVMIDYHIKGNTFGSDHIPDEEDANHLMVYFQ